MASEKKMFQIRDTYEANKGKEGGHFRLCNTIREKLGQPGWLG